MGVARSEKKTLSAGAYVSSILSRCTLSPRFPCYTLKNISPTLLPIPPSVKQILRWNSPFTSTCTQSCKICTSKSIIKTGDINQRLEMMSLGYQASITYLCQKARQSEPRRGRYLHLPLINYNTNSGQIGRQLLAFQGR